jgi:hypothetical protein
MTTPTPPSAIRRHLGFGIGAVAVLLSTTGCLQVTEETTNWPLNSCYEHENSGEMLIIEYFGEDRFVGGLVDQIVGIQTPTVTKFAGIEDPTGDETVDPAYPAETGRPVRVNVAPADDAAGWTIAGYVATGDGVYNEVDCSDVSDHIRAYRSDAATFPDHPDPTA